MRRAARIAGVGAAIAAAALQFARPERDNPPVDPARTLEALAPMTPAAAAVFDRACRDCHSNRTRWPWYSQVAPVSWLVAGHVNHARSHINVSDWALLPAADMPRLAYGMCRLAREGSMPLASYQWLHRDARLSPEDVEALCLWAEGARGLLLARLTPSTEAAPASPR